MVIWILRYGRKAFVRILWALMSVSIWCLACSVAEFLFDDWEE